MAGSSSPNGECGCPDAVKWRAYWTAAAIGERLAREVELYRAISRRRDHEAAQDVRGAARMSNAPIPHRSPPFAELEARRAVVHDWRTLKR